MTSPFPPSTRLVAYLRDSGGREQDLSVAQQKQAAGEWCREHGYILTRIFEDVARSGTSLAGRDQFLAMVTYLDGNVPESGVIIWEYARLAREYDTAQYYLADLRRRGVVVHSITDSVPDNLEGRLLEAVISWKNASFSRDLSRNVKRGLVYTARVYHATYGDPPAGYKNIQHEIGTRRDGAPHIISRLEPDERTAPLVQRAFAMRAAGATAKEIQDEVGLFRWSVQYYKMFRNPVYLGIRRFGEHEIEAFCEPLIDQATWDAVQAVNAARATRSGSNHPRTVRSQYILSGLLHCGLCDYLMTGSRSRHAPYPPEEYYRCQLAKNAFGSCSASQIPKDMIEKRVSEIMQNHILEPAIIQEAYDRAREQIAAGDQNRQAELARIRLDQQDTARAIQRLVAAIREAGHSAALLTELEQAEQTQREQQENLARLEAHRPQSAPDVDAAHLVEIVRHKLVTAPPAEIGVVLRGWVVSVTATRPKRGDLTGRIDYHLPFGDDIYSVDL